MHSKHDKVIHFTCLYLLNIRNYTIVTCQAVSLCGEKGKGKLRFGPNHVQIIPGTLLPSRDHVRSTQGAYLSYSFGYPCVRFFVSGERFGPFGTSQGVFHLSTN